MKFKVGDKILCIKDKHPDHTRRTPKIGKMYTVTAVYPHHIFTGDHYSYNSSCFIYPNLTKLEKLIFNITT